MLGAKGIERRMIARPAGRREMRATSQTFAATGSPQVRTDDGTVVAEAVASRTINRSASLRPSTLQTLFAHGAAHEGCLDQIFTENRVDSFKRARFGEHFHQLR